MKEKIIRGCVVVAALALSTSAGWTGWTGWTPIP
jgi:hypothetical protein